MSADVQPASDTMVIDTYLRHVGGDGDEIGTSGEGEFGGLWVGGGQICSEQF